MESFVLPSSALTADAISTLVASTDKRSILLLFRFSAQSLRSSDRSLPDSQHDVRAAILCFIVSWLLGLQANRSGADVYISQRVPFTRVRCPILFPKFIRLLCRYFFRRAYLNEFVGGIDFRGIEFEWALR